MRRIDVLLNERAGSTGQDSGERIRQAFAAEGAEVRVRQTPGDRLAAQAEQAARDGAILVAAGGDGTVSTIAAVAADAGATFGVIPLGTLNHFAKDTGIPLELDAAVRVILDGRVDPLDIGCVNGHAFVNNASAGFYARVARERYLEQRRGHMKWTAFAMGLARAWSDYRPLRVRVRADGTAREVTTPFVFVGNGDYVTEGLSLGRRCSVSTGCLSVYLAPECTRAEFLAMAARAVAGRLTDDGPLERVSVNEVTIDTHARQTAVAIDGEVITVRGALACSLRRGALRTLRPPAGKETI